MAKLIWILLILVQTVWSARPGVTHCTAGTLFPPSMSTVSSSAPLAATRGVMVQDGAAMFTCCGVVQGLAYHAARGGNIDAQVWRQTGANAFELISQATYTLTAGSPGSFTPADNARLSFQEGDMMGWYGSGGVLVNSIPSFVSRTSTSIGALAVGASHDWSSETLDDAQYLMQYDVTASTAPFFKNLPAKLNYADTETLITGKTLLTLTVSDLDPDDVSGLTVEMDPQWNDYFALNSGTLAVTTARMLEPGEYKPEFRVEESHCGKSATATLTVSVTDSAPSITNLPASASVHEDTRDETLLYTVTTSDANNQGIWCKGDWTPGTGGSEKPFIVKMLSTTGGDSRAGIYLIEEPSLDYDVTASFYSLSMTCTDTAGNTDTEDFYVNVEKNQLPIFTNLGNMVEVDATVVKIGTNVFTVSISDAESDQVTYTYTCTPAGDCPFALYDNGDVVVTSNLLSWTTASYTLSITATDLRDSNTARELIVYIKNRNTAPTLDNLDASVTVAENTALGTSLFQVSASDAESDTLTFYRTMDTDEGWKIAEMSATGEVTTHSTYSINYETLTATVHKMIVYVHDGKATAVSATLTITVENANETLAFTQTTYGLSDDEGTVIDINPLNSANIGVTDPDAGDTVTYAMDCGTYDSYFTMDSTTAIVSYAQDYDLDTGSVPTEVTCSLTATDSAGFNDTAQLFIVISYVNDHAPTFSPTTYSATVKSTTPLGFSVLRMTATDADRNDDGEMTFSLDPLTQGDITSRFLVDNNGVLYTSQNMASAAALGVQTFKILAIDGGSTAKTGTASVTLTFQDASVAATTTTDRNWGFKDDSRNTYWLTAAVVTCAACLFVIILIIVRYCMARTEPFCKDWWTSPKKETAKRPLDKKRRPKPFGRQQKPNYQHVHSKEVLRPSPPPSLSPDPADDDKFSTRALSANSTVGGRVNLSQVHLKDKTIGGKGNGKEKAKDDDINSWMGGSASPAKSVAPQRAVARPKPADQDYLSRGRRRARNQAVHDSPAAPTSPSLTLPGSSRLDQSDATMNVTPSPVQWDNTGGHVNDSFVPGDDADAYDADDFLSERLSIASPVTVHSTVDHE